MWVWYVKNNKCLSVMPLVISLGSRMFNSGPGTCLLLWRPQQWRRGTAVAVQVSPPLTLLYDLSLWGMSNNVQLFLLWSVSNTWNQIYSLGVVGLHVLFKTPYRMSEGCSNDFVNFFCSGRAQSGMEVTPSMTWNRLWLVVSLWDPVSC